MAIAKKVVPAAEQREKVLPEAGMKSKEIPSAEIIKKEKPHVGNSENCVVIGGTEIEIKPTKLKYQRNRTAAFYRLLEMYPLTDILAMDTDSFGDGRDGDKAVMDWLIAVTDNEDLIVDNYDEIDTATVEKLLEIFRRINRIDEKEAKLKNAERTGKGAA